MQENVKIGLSRSRLFDFQNVVSFAGEAPEPFDLKELNKALRMLSVKEPLITAGVYLDASFDAYLQFGKVQPEAEASQKDVESFLKEQINSGIDFTKELFRFFVVDKNTLVILSHTVVSDSKSLLILAKELISFYNKESVEVEPKQVKCFSNESDLPRSVDSFVAERVAEVLDNNYLLKPQSFTHTDYVNAKISFSHKYGDTDFSGCVIDEKLCDSLKEKCNILKIDFSSLVLFALSEALKQNKRVTKKNAKVNVYADRRPFFVERDLYSVGAFNGTVAVEVSERNVFSEENAKKFHDALYKKMCVCFNTFYNELFLSKLTPSFLDSCFMYKAGVYKNKYTKKLATLYGCEQQFMCSFESVNLNQQFWGKLSTFCHVRVKEPHKSNFNVSFSLVTGKKNQLLAEWNSAAFSKKEIDELFEKTLSLLRQL